MKPPYFVVNLKADLSVDDCVHFLNSITDDGKRRFFNLYVALPLSRLQEMSTLDPDSGIIFGAAMLNRVDAGAFTQPIAGKMVKDAGGHFVLIGSQDESKIFGTTDEHIQAKLESALQASLRPVFCLSGFSKTELKKRLQLLKNCEKLLSRELPPMIAYELPYRKFKSYLPSAKELSDFHVLIKEAMEIVFDGEPIHFPLLASLPSDLAGFSSLIESMPFEGGYFIKSGAYPHTIHQETLKLFHVHCQEQDLEKEIQVETE